MIRTISVIGAGGWGTALACLLAEKGRAVHLWAHRPDHAAHLAATRENADYLPGVRLPDGVTVTADLGAVAAAALLVLVVPSRHMREVGGQLVAAGARSDAVLVSGTKGIEAGSGRLMTQVLEECLPGARTAVLSGPNLAAEIARRVPAAGVIGSTHAALLGPLQELFTAPAYRVYTSEDAAGIQLGGALKNVFAIGAGVSDGLGMGDNAKAALVTRALTEMVRLGVSLGGRRETFSGLSGIGDLMVTCFSPHSRNRRFGERVGRGETPADIQAGMKMVAEGVPTATSALECARRLGVETPIIAQVHAVLHEARPPREAMLGLLDRPPKPEADR